MDVTEQLNNDKYTHICIFMCIYIHMPMYIFEANIYKIYKTQFIYVFNIYNLGNVSDRIIKNTCV